MQLALLLLLLLIPGAALAQQPPPPSLAQQEPAVLRGLVLALQQMGVATEQYVAEMRQQLAAKDAKIVELQRLCGEACK